jgi:hypothetical protein
MPRKAARMLAPAFRASIFINGFPLQFKHLYDRDGFVTGSTAVSSSIGAPVDVRNRAGIGFADD